MLGLRGAFGNQAFRQGNQFGASAVHLPVAIEKQKGRLAMEAAELIEAFCERQDLELEGLPVCRARASSFRVNSMLCSTSFARSSIDADDRLPVPVLEKLGSGWKR